MSLESAKVYLKQFSTDADFRASLESATTPEARKSIINEAGYDFSRDEVQSLALEATQGQLTEQELEAVSGGRMVEWAGVVATAIGAVAAAF